MEDHRKHAQELAKRYLERNDPTGWFERLYASAHNDPAAIPWADLKPNPNITAWLERERMRGEMLSALVIGCGLGDDAEELAAWGFDTVAFDISESAIRWCRKRFPDTTVKYGVHDLFAAPEEWRESFDLVLEAYTLQALPDDLRVKAFAPIASFVAPGGILLVVARGRDETDPLGEIPWPLTRAELETFTQHGLRLEQFEDYFEQEAQPVRRFRASYRKA